MRCEWCREPGRVPKQVEICRDCGPRFYAMEAVVEAAMAWDADTEPFTTAEKALHAACAALAPLLKAGQ